METRTTLTRETGKMDIKTIKNLIIDFKTNSRWATVKHIEDGIESTVNLRVIGIGRVFVRTMSGYGLTHNTKPEDITKVW